MHIETLHPNTKKAFLLVGTVPIVKNAYLAGGTALALHLGHRISEDLDFFTQEEFDEEELNKQMSILPTFELYDQKWRTIKGLVENTKFSLFWYKYNLVEEPIVFEGIRVLNKKDLAAMKLHAISGRGTKRDYIDLFFLRKEFRLIEVISYYETKYGDFESRAGVILRALNYFLDADDDIMPVMLTKVDWSEVKEFFEQDARDFAKEYIGLDTTHSI